MVASTDIRYYVHTNQKAPQLENAYGSMLNVLDACLVNGFGSQTVESLTADNTTVTADFGKAHNFLQYQVIKIEGAVQEEFNGEHRIISVTTNTISFDIAQPASTSRASGLISCSLPPLGWEKPFASQNPSGGGKGAYRSKNTLLSSRPFLRVVDELDPLYNADWAKYAKVGIVEDMLDIDTMMGKQTPYDTARPNQNWIMADNINGWVKWYYSLGFNENTSGTEDKIAQNGSRSWVIIGSQDYFFILCRTHTEQSFYLRHFPYFFGHIDSDYFKSTALVALIHYQAVNKMLKPYDVLGLSYSKIENILLDNGLNGEYAICRSETIYPDKLRSGYTNIVKKPISKIPVVTGSINIFDKNNIPRGHFPCVEFVYDNLPYKHLQAFNTNGCMKIAVGSLAYEDGMLLFDLGDINES